MGNCIASQFCYCEQCDAEHSYTCPFMCMCKMHHRLQKFCLRVDDREQRCSSEASTCPEAQGPEFDFQCQNKQTKSEMRVNDNI